jgi:hypothetical protein
MTNTADIAVKLSEAQKRAILCLPSNGAKRYSFERSEIPGLSGLRRKGLAEPAWSAFPREHPWALTPLGIEVQASLRRQLLENSDV